MTDADTKTASLPEIDDEQLQALVDRFLTQGETLKSIKGLSDPEMEAIYSVAYHMFQHGQFEKAESVFRFLCFFDHLEHKYWLGLGACRKAGKDFTGAIDAFGLAGLLDVNDPRPAMESAECHLQLGNRPQAISALNAALTFGADRPEFTALRERAQMVLQFATASPAAGGSQE